MKPTQGRPGAAAVPGSGQGLTAPGAQHLGLSRVPSTAAHTERCWRFAEGWFLTWSF